jgi:hypothetical protein
MSPVPPDFPSLTVFHGPAHRHAADPEILRDGLHAAGTAAVGRGERSIPVRITLSIFTQGFRQCATLGLRNIVQRSLGIDRRLHAFDERLGAEIDLIFQLAPRTGGVDPFGNEPAVHIAEDDAAPLVVPRRDVVERTGEFQP